MNVQFTLLSTDLGLWSIAVLISIYAYWARTQPTHQNAWRKLLTHHHAVSATVTVGFLFCIALLDSIHWTYTSGLEVGHVNSALDHILKPMMLTESSYSAPFATHTFTPNTQGISDMLTHIEPIHTIMGWVAICGYSLMCGLLGTVCIWSLSSIHTGYYQGRKAYFKQLIAPPSTPQRLAHITLFIWLTLSALCIVLAPHYHLLGTDKIGADVLYACIKSIRTGWVIGSLTLLFMLPCAICLGLCAGFFGGWIDDVIQFIYTVLSAIPAVLLISTAVLTLQVFIYTHASHFPSMVERADLRLLVLCVILGLTGWTPLARLLRAETFKLREMPYLEAAKLMGSSRTYCLFKHLLPNVMHLVLMAVVLDFSGLVLAEAVLSYIGVGVDPSTYSWGNTINAARLELARTPIVWWPLTGAFTFMFALVWPANILADTLRMAFNPRIQR